MQLPDGFRDVLPLFSYIVNILTKVLEVFASYLGIDIKLPTQPAEQTPTADASTTAQA